MKLWMMGRPETAREVKDEHCNACEYVKLYSRTQGGDISFIEDETGMIRRTEVLLSGRLVIVRCSEVTRKDAEREIGMEEAS